MALIMTASGLPNSVDAADKFTYIPSTTEQVVVPILSKAQGFYVSISSQTNETIITTWTMPTTCKNCSLVTKTATVPAGHPSTKKLSGNTNLFCQPLH